MKTITLYLLAFTLSFSLSSCKNDPSATAPEDPLPSWNATSASKAAIIDFVDRVTKEGGSDFVPAADRIAVFDNDGTLWAEQPIYSQVFFIVDRLNFLSEQHPEWQEQEPQKSVLKEGAAAFGHLHTPDLLQLMLDTHTGMSAEEFEAIVTTWLDTAVHPATQKPYTQMVYQPMLELLEYLRANDFKTFIVSGGGIEFMRPWTEEVYGISKEQVIGSKTELEFVDEGGETGIQRSPVFKFLDDEAGKPVAIQEHIGRRPIFCAGNSDGDLAMMEFTDGNSLPNFELYIHHTDAEREWAYDRESHIGHFSAGLDSALAKQWTLVDMQNDWKVIYP